MIPKTFDCLVFKAKVQEEIYEQTKDMNPQQEADWYREQALSGPLGKFIERVQKAQSVRKSGKAA